MEDLVGTENFPVKRVCRTQVIVTIKVGTDNIDQEVVAKDQVAAVIVMWANMYLFKQYFFGAMVLVCNRKSVPGVQW